MVWYGKAMTGRVQNRIWMPHIGVGFHAEIKH
jgi:hypothetical protein